MKPINKSALLPLLLLSAISLSANLAFAKIPEGKDYSNQKISLNLKSKFIDTINDSKIEKNALKDYGMSSNPTANQSDKLQFAIDDISKNGGGKLIIPAGIFCFGNVYMKSNVHILVDKDAILKPFRANKKGVAMFHFTTEDDKSTLFIQNCSIRGLNGSYTVDYSDTPDDQRNISTRFIINRMVKNFLIADANIKDNFTIHCGIIFVPTKAKGADKWELSRPTNGEIRNCSIENASSGYGLNQLHGADNLYFENIHSIGGVCLRLESGAGGEYAGVFNIQAKNVSSENARATIMMNPHTTKNGLVEIDGVKAKSSSFAVLMHKGFIDRKNKDNPDATIGCYSSDSIIANIHAIYGEDAQVDDKEVFVLEPSEQNYAKLRENSYGNLKSLIGPSLTTVFDTLEGHYKVAIRNMTSEGFEKYTDRPLYIEEIQDRNKDKWNILKSTPVMKQRIANGITERKIEKKEKTSKKNK